MSGIWRTQLKRWLRSHLLARGEKSIASIGGATVAVFLGAIAANGWWMLNAARESDAALRVTQISAIGGVLSRSAEVMLSSGDVSAVRRLVTETSRTFHLDKCRIILGPNQVLADSTPSRINQRVLPEKWNFGPLDGGEESSSSGSVSMRYPILVNGKGTATLELVASAPSPWWIFWRAQGGFALIGAAGLGVILIVYRRNRSKLIALEAIQDGLCAYAAGHAPSPALGVDARHGLMAQAWNKLLAELEEARHQASLGRVNQTRHDRRAGATSLESACDTMSQGLILVDARLRVRFANGAASAFLNMPRQDLLDKPIAELIANEKIREAIGAITSGKQRRPITLELEQEGNTGGVLRFSVRPVRKGDTDAVTIILEDITQQRVADRARNSFITQVTHELRTPLTNIRLYVEAAMDPSESGVASQSTCLDIINRESRRLERIVGAMLSVAEIEAGACSIHKDDVHLDELFKELEADYQAQAEDKQIKLNFALPPKVPIIQADRDKITLAIHNLLGNALKYTPQGGKVTVSADLKDGKLHIEVADSGIGIRPEEQETIFERFSRSKDPRVRDIVGTGLGLALARDVMRLHGGDVVVQSELNRGSIFIATLPATADAA